MPKSVILQWFKELEPCSIEQQIKIDNEYERTRDPQT